MLQFNTIHFVWGNTPYSSFNIQIHVLLQILSTINAVEKEQYNFKGLFVIHNNLFYLQPVNFEDEEVEVFEGLVESVSFER